MILRESKTRHKNLEMLWVDYKKAYDSVPHTWIIECLCMFKVCPTVVSFIDTSMNNWKTDLFLNQNFLGSVTIRRGIFQGDSMSPLLFVLSLLPLSILLRREPKGYHLHCGTKINHLLYMDDLKLFARNYTEIESLLHSVSVFSSDIGMSFGLEKCAHLSLHRGKVVASDEIVLPDGQSIKSLSHDDTYKYLECDDIKCSAMITKLKNEYIRRLKALLRSCLNARNMVCAINFYALPVY